MISILLTNLMIIYTSTTEINSYMQNEPDLEDLTASPSSTINSFGQVYGYCTMPRNKTTQGVYKRMDNTQAKLRYSGPEESNLQDDESDYLDMSANLTETDYTPSNYIKETEVTDSETTAFVERFRDTTNGFDLSSFSFPNNLENRIAQHTHSFPKPSDDNTDSDDIIDYEVMTPQPDTKQKITAKMNETHYNRIEEDEEHIYEENFHDFSHKVFLSNLKTKSPPTSDFSLPYPIDYIVRYYFRLKKARNRKSFIKENEKKYLKTISDLNALYLKPVEIKEEDCLEYFVLKTTNKLYRYKSQPSCLFFIEFKKIIVELLLFFCNIDVYFSESRYYFSGSTTNRCIQNLISLYDLVIEENDVYKYFKRENLNDLLDEPKIYVAASILNRVMKPKYYVSVDDPLIYIVLADIDKNTKKFNQIPKAFDSHTLLIIKIDKNNKIYNARYYIVAVVLRYLLNIPNPH